MKHLFLSHRFFWLFGSLIFFFLISFPVGFLFPVAQTCFVFAVALVLFDIWQLYQRNVQVECQRILPKVFSLGDANLVQLALKNTSPIPLKIAVIDEIPIEFQKRDFIETLQLDVGQSHVISYELTPLVRGEYQFGKVNIFISSKWDLVQRRIQQDTPIEVPVYPSILQMKQYALQAFSKISHHQGIKKMRRIGHSYEFEQIKKYMRGDDYRSLNWKATSRRGVLMVNQYEEERSQQIYSIIDKSRSMRMPFGRLSLMDYAINTSLAISNIALQKQDRVGLFTFSDKIGTVLKADNKAIQLNKILQALYKEKERDLEANYELLYQAVHRLINRRSLLVLYTNFESTYALERVLPILRKINTSHLLLVVFFENTEIKNFSKQPAKTLEDIYHQTVAQKYVAEKTKIAQKLRQYGIQSVLTRPEDLSINTINKYLELKARGLT